MLGNYRTECVSDQREREIAGEGGEAYSAGRERGGEDAGDVAHELIVDHARTGAGAHHGRLSAAASAEDAAKEVLKGARPEGREHAAIHVAHFLVRLHRGVDLASAQPVLLVCSGVLAVM
jgi:hypothetical protein